MKSPIKKELEHFCRIFELRNLSDAALELDIDQGNLSRQVKRLESEFGTKLFERHRGGVVPTSDANELYENLKLTKLHWVQLCSEKQVKLRSRPIKIATHSTLASAYLGHLLSRLEELFPECYPEIELCGSLKATRLLQRRKVDLALLANPVKINDLVPRTVAQEKVLLCSSHKKLDKFHLIRNPEMLNIDKLTKNIRALSVVNVSDYEVAAAICRQNQSYACVIPSTVFERSKGLSIMSELKSNIKIRLVTYSGSRFVGQLTKICNGK